MCSNKKEQPPIRQAYLRKKTWFPHDKSSTKIYENPLKSSDAHHAPRMFMPLEVPLVIIKCNYKNHMFNSKAVIENDRIDKCRSSSFFPESSTTSDSNSKWPWEKKTKTRGPDAVEFID